MSGFAFALEQVAEPREVGVAERLEFLVELLGPGRAVALDDLALEREAGVIDWMTAMMVPSEATR